MTLQWSTLIKMQKTCYQEITRSTGKGKANRIYGNVPAGFRRNDRIGLFEL